MEITSFNISTLDGYTYDLKLNNRVVCVRGNSASGKTYLFNQLKVRKRLPITESNHSIYDKLVLIDMDSIATAKLDLKEPQRDKLYIIDEADIVLREVPEFIDYINTNKECSFLLMLRDLKLIHLHPYYSAALKVDGKQVILDYDYLTM